MMVCVVQEAQKIAVDIVHWKSIQLLLLNRVYVWHHMHVKIFRYIDFSSYIFQM